jgi:hypothetical protein
MGPNGPAACPQDATSALRRGPAYLAVPFIEALMVTPDLSVVVE